MTHSTDPTPVGDTLPEVLTMIQPTCADCRQPGCRLLTTPQVAEYLGIHYKTAQEMLAAKAIPGALKTSPRGRYRVRLCRVQAYEAKLRRAS